GTLAAHGQAAAVPHAAVGTHLDVPLDIHRDFLAQVAFDGAFLFEDLAHAIDFVFSQIADLLIEVDAGPVEQRTRTAASDAVDISKADLRSLLGRQIHACNTCHDSLLSLALLMLRIGTDDPHHALAMDHLALVANLFD